MKDKELIGTISTFLKYRKENGNLSLEEISNRSGLSVSYISRLLNNQIESPSLETLMALSQAFDTTIYELLNIKTEDDNEFIPTLEELILRNRFIYNGNVVELNVKKSIINLISALLEFNMDNNIEEVANICNLLMKYSAERKCKEEA
ncbi:helix-turn-helix domain-containing protein [Tepidibacter formicigenes]|jgi:transcriptional regulator with XRE-family HTH domain|uniref:Helix-turn-helix n=1 Tax=Tepidibacter formicigenes DSM 15518 TaxID=1123349 RepID=A0A1M6QJU0_9FIRM|nr:helix-turn-helix transcriptional regulator [Tepidibacter formicigenes]SHK20297.1 Helix-turn-helix [Tepidibacter formicigenes DSM 15518]